MQTVLGLVGEKGSGKETFTIFLEELAPNKKIAHIRFSDLLKETLEDWSLPQTRENLQKLAVVLNTGFGEGTLSHAICERVKNTQAEIIVIDGVRWDSDVELVRTFDKNFLIYITADLETRFERLKKRGEKQDEETTSFEQFKKEEQAPNEILISQIGSKADFKLENNGSFEELKTKIADLYKKL